MTIKLVDLFGKIPPIHFQTAQAAHEHRIAMNRKHKAHGRFRIVTEAKVS